MQKNVVMHKIVVATTSQRKIKTEEKLPATKARLRNNGGSSSRSAQISLILMLTVTIIATILQTAECYPSVMTLPSELASFHTIQHSIHMLPSRTSAQVQDAPATQLLSANKRAFDRLDVSPFDFESLSKRFHDDDDVYYGRRRRAFDRLDDNTFLGLMSRKRRAFDRLEDGPFMLGKRSAGLASDYQLVEKRPFDRLDSSVFGIAKRHLPIADVVRRLESNDNNKEMYADNN